MNTVVVWFGVVFPSCCVLVCFLIARHYFVLANTAAKKAAFRAEEARLAAQEADCYADDAHEIATRLEPAEKPDAVPPPSVDNRPTEVMERITLFEEEADVLARTPAQRVRAAGAAGVGKHRLSPIMEANQPLESGGKR